MFRKFIITLFFAIVLLLTIPAYVTAAYVQGYYGESASPPASTAQVTFQKDVTAGNLLICVLKIKTDVSATVTAGAQTFSLTKNQPSGVSGWAVNVYSLPNATGGPTTVNASAPGGDHIRMSILEYSGIATSSPVHKTVSAEDYGSSVNAGQFTTTIANCTLFVVVGTDTDGEGFSAGSGFTLRDFGIPQPNTPDKSAVEDNVAVDAGTYSGTMSISRDSWAAVLVAYKPSDTPLAAPKNLRIIP